MAPRLQELGLQEPFPRGPLLRPHPCGKRITPRALRSHDLDVTETSTKSVKFIANVRGGRDQPSSSPAPGVPCPFYRREVTSQEAHSCQAGSVPGLQVGMLPAVLVDLRPLSCLGSALYREPWVGSVLVLWCRGPGPVMPISSIPGVSPLEPGAQSFSTLPCGARLSSRGEHP